MSQTNTQLSAVPLQSRPWGVGGWLLVVAAFAVGFVNVPLRVVGWGFEYLPGDSLDNRINNYILEHGYRYLAGRTGAFWSAPMFYPEPNVTGFSDAHLGLLPMYTLVRTAGLTPEEAFQGWFVIPFALNFVSAGWALRRLGGAGAGVAAGSLVFAFGLPLAAQFVHSQLLPRFLIPPAVVFGWEFLQSPRTGKLAACVACIVGQTYVSVYNGYFLVLMLATGAALAFLRFGPQLCWTELLRPGWQVWLARMATIVASALALAPLVLGHAQFAGGVDAADIHNMAPPLRAWLSPPFISAAAACGIYGSNLQIEHLAFPGIIPLGAVCVAAASGTIRQSITGRWAGAGVAAGTVVCLALLVTTFEGLWLYRPLAELPGTGSIRAVGRIVLVLLFPMAVSVAAVVDDLVGRAGRLGKPVAWVVAIAAIGTEAADQWLSSPQGDRAAAWDGQRTRLEEVVAEQDALKLMIRRRSAATLVYAYPSGTTFPAMVRTQLAAMRASQDLGIPCVNGYSGYFPFRWHYFETRGELNAWLQSRSVRPEVVAGLVELGGPPVE